MRVSISKEDLWAAQRLHARPTGGQTCLYMFIVPLLILFVYDRLNWPIEKILFVGACGAVGVLVYMYVYLRYKSFKIYKQQKMLRETFELTWDESGFEIENKRSKSNIKWGEIHRVRENKELVLYYYSDSLFGVVNKNLFDNAGERNDFISKLRREDS